MKPKEEIYGSLSSPDGFRREYATLEPCAGSVVKAVTLRRRGSTPLGFSIRGGWEHGTGVYVSEVIPGSIAHKQGLKVGDQILRINGFSIHRAIHMEVLSLLKTCPGIVLKIKRVGILPIKEREKDPVSWKAVETHSALITSDQVTHSRVGGTPLETSIIVKVEMKVPASSSLGCSIAKGPSSLAGIFMCTVKAGGAAEQAGLEVGDQILDVNGTACSHTMPLNEAVALMKSAKDIRLTVKKGAGISLFLDNGQESNGNKIEDSMSTTRSLSDGMSSDIKEAAGAFSGGSCSSKSSSFQSSDSEKDYSLSEESAFEGRLAAKSHAKWPPTSVGGHKKQPSSSSSSKETSVGDSWLEEERRRLEEEKQRLHDEKLQLQEERRRLQLEKMSSSCTSSSSSPPPGSLQSVSESLQPSNSFLSELQKAAAKMSEGKATLEEGGKRKEELTKKKSKEDPLKRMQHEMLMEEFREAHRKMFGQNTCSITEDEKPQNGESAPASLDLTKVNFKAKSAPPPPPPKTTDTNHNGRSKKECQKITVNGQIPGFTRQQVLRPEKPADKKVTEAPQKPTLAGVRVAVSADRRPNGDSMTKTGTLVQVTPWNTRL